MNEPDVATLRVLEHQEKASYAQQLEAEVASWLLEDTRARAEKFRRERMRHYRLLRDLRLDVLGTEEMEVLEVGGGPMPVSDLLPFKRRVVVDPLTAEYRRVLPCPDHVATRAEDVNFTAEFDLAIATNSLDHVERPERVFARMNTALRPGGYLAILCAHHNATTNPHPAHVHNLSADTIHRWADRDYETVWELTYQRDGLRYGWVLWEGRRGQPAFALLLRKCSGYV